MTDKPRITIAAALTALFVAGISAAGLAARDHPRQATATARASAVAGDSAAAGGGDHAEADGYVEMVEKALGIDKNTRDAINGVAQLVRGHDDDE